MKDLTQYLSILSKMNYCITLIQIIPVYECLVTSNSFLKFQLKKSLHNEVWQHFKIEKGFFLKIKNMKTTIKIPAFFLFLKAEVKSWFLVAWEAF